MPLTIEVDLTDRVVLVTGAARNLPAVIAQEFAQAGAAIVINYHESQDAAEAVVQTIRGGGTEAMTVQADVSQRDEAEAMIAQVRETLGPIDVLVHGAGPFDLTPFMALPEATWDRLMDVNLKAIYLLSQLVAPEMMERGWGRIFTISAGSADLRNHSIYGLSKAAVRILTESLALELAPAVTVNAVSPSQIEESTPDIQQYDPTYVDRSIAATPLDRLVTRREIARMMVFMCSPVFDFVTGQTLRMDGGKGIPVW